MRTYKTLVFTLARSTLRESVGLFFTLIFAPMLVVILGLIFRHVRRLLRRRPGGAGDGDHGRPVAAGEPATTPGERCPDAAAGDAASSADLRCRRPHRQLPDRSDGDRLGPVRRDRGLWGTTAGEPTVSPRGRGARTDRLPSARLHAGGLLPVCGRGNGHRERPDDPAHADVWGIRPAGRASGGRPARHELLAHPSPG